MIGIEEFKYAVFSSIPRSFTIEEFEIEEEHQYTDSVYKYGLDEQTPTEILAVSGSSEKITEYFDGDDDDFVFFTTHRQILDASTTTVEHPIGTNKNIILSGNPEIGEVLITGTKKSIEFSSEDAPVSGSNNIKVEYITDLFIDGDDYEIEDDNIKWNASGAKPSGSTSFYTSYLREYEIDVNPYLDNQDLELTYPAIILNISNISPDSVPPVNRLLKHSKSGDIVTLYRGERPRVNLSVNVLSKNTTDSNNDSIVDGISNELLEWFFDDFRSILLNHQGSIKTWNGLKNLNDIVDKTEYRSRRQFDLNIELPMSYTEQYNIIKDIKEISVTTSL